MLSSVEYLSGNVRFNNDFIDCFSEVVLAGLMLYLPTPGELNLSLSLIICSM